MTEEGASRQDLLRRIDGRRASIDEYLRRVRPRGNRLVTVSIVSSALAAIFTAGPALGGETFSAGVASGLSLSNDSAVWRALCFLALIVSVVAAISTNLSRSQDIAGRIAAAEATNAELEGLRMLLEYGRVTVGDAASLYQQYLTKIPFVDEQPARPPDGWNPPPQNNPPPGPRPGTGRRPHRPPPGPPQPGPPPPRPRRDGR